MIHLFLKHKIWLLTFIFINQLTISQNTAPVITDIPNQSIAEGGTFTSINLDDYITDVETPDANIVWSVDEIPTNIVVTITNRVASIAINDANWNGNETITFRAVDEGAAEVTDQVTFEVTPVNDLPVITDIPNQSIAEGGTFTSINLDDYITDVETTDANIVWSVDEIPTNIVVTITNRVASIAINDANWNGNETITFRAVDEGAAEVTDQVTFEVTPVNDLPVITDIPNQSIAEGGTFTSINLDDYITDVETADANIVWSVDETPANITVTITNQVATIAVNDINWNGDETITFRATDESNASVSDQVSFTVGGVNDSPIMTIIPDQSIAEGATFSDIILDDFISDVETVDANMVWSIDEVPENITVTITNRIASIAINDVNWNGTETITFRATDEGGLAVTDLVAFTVTPVNDLPVISDIPDQTIAEESTFTIINLDHFISDIETADAAIVWTIDESPANITVSITNRVAFITINDVNWNGTETITFRAADEGGAEVTDQVSFTVTPVNDLPVISNIPNQSISEGGTFTDITLGDFITDVETIDANIVWTIDETPADITITITNQVASVAVNDVNWNGTETVTFRAADEDGAEVIDVVSFTVGGVNDSPVITDISDQSIAEGGIFTNIILDNYISDLETVDANIIWSIDEVPVNITVTITNRIASVVVNDVNWNGTESVTFRATDEGGAEVTDLVSFTVTPVNDAPVILNIPDQSVAEGNTFADINLDNFISDVETADATIIWSIDEVPANITVTITNRVASIAINDPNWNGTESVTFRAADEGGAEVTDQVSFTVTPVNDPPVISDIPDQSIAEGASFTTISLDDFISDLETTDANIVWSIDETPVNITITITNQVASIVVNDVNWNGTETITFRATDEGGASVTDPVSFTVTPVNDPPVISDIPNQSISEGSSFTAIHLDDFITDIETADANIIWSIDETPNNIVVTITDRVASISINDVNWNGTEVITFRAADESGVEVTDQVSFSVGGVNDSPQISPIPNQSISEGSNFVNISLDDYITDVETPDENMIWSIDETPTHITVTINNRVASIAVNDMNWNGTEAITFRATDEGGEQVTELVSFTVTPVNDLPVISTIPDQSISEGSTFSIISLDDYIADIETNDENILWTIDEVPENISVTIINRVASVAINDINWNGSETITFRAADQSGAEVTDQVLFTVTPINDLPVINVIPDQIISEGEVFTNINLDNYINDVETVDADILWSIVEVPTHITVSIINRMASISINDNEWNGTELITFRAEDSDGAGVTDRVAFTVTPVNDPPEITGQNPISVAEETLRIISFSDILVSDPDNNYPVGFSMTLQNGEGYTVVDNSITPELNVTGNITVPVYVTDPEDAISNIYNLVVTIVNDNDPPVLIDIPNQTINEGEAFNTINLNLFVSDADHSDDQIIWSYTGDTDLVVDIDSDTRIATVSSPDENWNGQETITFTASDGSLTDSDDVTFTINPVNDAPVINGQSELSVNEDEIFTIPLSVLDVSDIDNTYPSEHTLTILEGEFYTISGQNIIPQENYNGSLGVSLMINDLGLVNSSSNTFVFDVDIIPVNDAPVIHEQINALTTNEDESVAITVDDLDISDPDNVNSDFSIVLFDGNHYSIVDNEVLPDEDYFGPLVVDVIASDGGFVNSQSPRFGVDILVLSINDSPTADNFPVTTAENQSVNVNIGNHIADVDGNLNLSSLLITENVTHGTAIVDTENSIINYSPNVSFTGTDSFTYEICDTDNSCSSGIVTITVSNEAPTAVDDAVTLNEDESVDFNILQNDIDPQNNIDPTSISMTTDPEHGTLQILTLGEIRYTPEPDFYGTDEIIYQVCDEDGYCTSASVTYTVNAVNDQPEINSQQTINVVEDQSMTLVLDYLEVTDVDNVYPNDFILSVLPGSGYSFTGNTITPDRNFTGDLVVNLIVNDQQNVNNQSEVYEFSMQVLPVNDSPEITDQNPLSTNEDEPLLIEITDLIISDPDNIYPDDFVLVVLVGLNYTVTGNTLIPANNFHGNLNVPVYISDQTGQNDRSKTYNLVVEVVSQNDAPVANPINQSTSENVSLEIEMSGMVSDVDGNIDYTTFENINEPSFGELTVDIQNERVTYIPNTGYSGEDSFNFKFFDADGLVSNIATVTVNVQNEAPSAVHDVFETSEDVSSEFEVLENDSDPQSNIDLSTLIIVRYPEHGIAEVDNISGTISYTPNQNYYGTDVLSYRICDETGYCDEANVTITVTPVNDPPITQPDVAETLEDQSVYFSVLSNDSDIDSDASAFTLTVFTQPSNGQVSIVGGVNEVYYTPNDDYYGEDVFIYEVCDDEGLCSNGQVTVTVLPQNDAPSPQDDEVATSQETPVSVNVVNNDFDIDDNLDITSVKLISLPQNGNALVQSLTGEITYTPANGFSGVDAFDYQICDTNGSCAIATITINVSRMNIAPECVSDTVYMVDGDMVNINVQDNDSDENGDAITVVFGDYTSLTGEFTIINNGEISYASKAGVYCIEEVVLYQGCDHSGNCGNASLTFIISVSDSDNDGIPDYYEEQYSNTDLDEFPDVLDTDSDNDGISDLIEAAINDKCIDVPLDTDEDGIPDYRDTDSDNDEVIDAEEGTGDCDGDGIPDFRDDYDDCAERIDAPETFSPNGDGVNDYFVIQGVSDYDSNEIFIYNRWGGEVYHMKNYDGSWDGRSANSAIGSDELPQGTYFYVVKLKDGNQTKVIKGSVFIKK